MRSLMRTQLRLALSVSWGCSRSRSGCSPWSSGSAPAYAACTCSGVPLPWLLLGAGVYPVILALAAYYVRRAERIEADFTDMVGREQGPS